MQNTNSMTASTVTTPEPLLVFEKAVLAHAPEFNVACVARLRIAHDHNNDQGSISIRVNAALADFGKQTLMLNICPEIVDTCTVVAKSNDKLIPDRMFSMVPVSVTNSAAVSTIILCLDATGVVLIPPSLDGTTIKPAVSHAANDNLDAFAKICQSKTIHLHLSKQQFKDGDLHHLRTFSGALRARMLKAQSLDYKRLNAGKGAIEKDWRVFGQSTNPPPYCEPASARSVLGKRSRDADSPSPAAASAAPCSPPPPWSPTETNTPTTCSPSPAHIVPTEFTNDSKRSYRQRMNMCELHRQLSGLPDDLVREALAGSGHQHLLVPAMSAGTKTPTEGPVDDTDAGDAALTAKVDKIIQQRLDKLTKSAFKTLTTQRLHSLVETQLPIAAELFLNGAVSSHRDAFYEDCKANELAVREQIDEGITEMREVSDQCTKELEELGRQCVESLEEKSRGLDASAEQELERMKRWFGELAKGFFEKNKGEVGTVELGKTRRVSM